VKIRRSFDYIVVGAGSAGCAVAARLTEDASCRVLPLEQGPPNNSWTIYIPGGLRENFKPTRPCMRWYPRVPQTHLDGRIIDRPLGLGFGGSSLVNGMVFLRGNRGTTTNGRSWVPGAGPMAKCCPISGGWSIGAEVKQTGGPWNGPRYPRWRERRCNLARPAY